MRTERRKKRVLRWQCICAGVLLMTDEQYPVGLVILANLISIICFLHIQQENYPDKVLCTKNKFGEGDWAGRVNYHLSLQCHVYIFHPKTLLAKFTIFLCHIDTGNPGLSVFLGSKTGGPPCTI